ncbi:MAG: hypothetical protein H0U74_13775 [Bradymonadaceae bacterium]|nr:hypothetical protein [Lujinxingiaceae bacterium]
MKIKSLQRSVLLACFVIALFLPALALGEDAHDRMLELSDQAAEAFGAGDVERAAGLYADAYAVKPLPILLRNQMIARFALGQCERAEPLGLAFLGSGEASPEDEPVVHRVFSDCALSRAEDALAAEESASGRVALRRAREFTLDADQSARAAVIEDGLASLEAAANTEPDPVIGEPAPAGAASGTKVAGWVLTGVGAGLIAGAAVWHVHALGLNDEYLIVAEAGQDLVRYNELNASLTTASWGVPTTYVVGAAMLTTGLYLAIFHNSQSTDQPALSVGLGPNGGHLGLRMPF